MPQDQDDIKGADAMKQALPPGSELWPVGSWLSAALDDPKVCDDMKADIRQWFDAGGHFRLSARPVASGGQHSSATVFPPDDVLACVPVAETAGEAVDEGVARERIEKIIKANVRSYGRGGALTFIGVENAAKVILAAYPSPPVPAQDDDKLRTALMDARHWHDARRDDLGKQPPSGDRDWRRMEHADEIARIDAALKSTGAQEGGE